MAFVGYRIDQHGEGIPAAAGMDYGDVFSRTFSRIAPEVTVYGSPDMAVRECDISEKEAAELEAICAAHLDATKEGGNDG